MLALIVLAFAGIVVRLASLQVRDNPELEALGLQQRIRSIPLPAVRGEIVDRSGVALAVSREARDVYVDPRYVVDAESEAETIADVPAMALPALLPCAVVRPALALMERQDYDPLRPRELPQWQRQWSIWRAARKPIRIFS